jgi:hypothetical protein
MRTVWIMLSAALKGMALLLFLPTAGFVLLMWAVVRTTQTNEERIKRSQNG